MPDALVPDGAVFPVSRFYEWECERLLRAQRRDVRWYRRLAGESGGPILELGSGAGRVSIDLAKSGWEVVGLDNQPYLVARARANAEIGGVAARTRFVSGDMRAFALARLFPLVILPFNTLGYLLTDEEVLACFRCVMAHLPPGGIFGFQVRPFELGEPNAPRGFVASGPCEDGQLEMYESVTVEPRSHISHYDEEYRLLRPGRPAVTFRQRLTLRSFYREEVESLLRAAGFRVRAVHGDFDGRPYPWPVRPEWPMLLEAVPAGGTATRWP